LHKVFKQERRTNNSFRDGIMKYCPKCGSPNQDQNLFCTRCGYKFPQQLPQQNAGAPSNPQNPNPWTSQPPYQPNQPMKGRKFPLIPVIAVVAVVIVVVGVLSVFLFTGSSSSRVVSAADEAFGGHWELIKNMSGLITLSGNYITYNLDNGTSGTFSATNVPPRFPIIFNFSYLEGYGVRSIDVYSLINGSYSLYICIFNFNSPSNASAFVGSCSESYPFEGAPNYTFSNGYFLYVSNQHINPEVGVIALSGSSVYQIYPYNFYSSPSQIREFLNSIT